jgi:Transglutaminase-like superfamily
VRMFRKLGLLPAMDWAERLRLVEAAFFLALARLAILVMPFRRIVPWLERSPDSPHHDAEAIADVRQAVESAARNVPWNAVCLPQAMACKAMLARRGQGSALHIGAARGTRDELMAHAWLVAGGEIVIGEDGSNDMTPLARFG